MSEEPRMMTRTVAGNVVAFLAAVIVLSFFLFALGTSWVWAILAGAVAYGLSLAVVPGLPRHRGEALPPGLDRQLIDEVVGGARAGVERLRKKSRLLPERAVRLKALAVCTTADKIVRELEREPRRIQNARPFLNYYLDATDRIIGRYLEISARRVEGEDVKQTLAKVEPTLDAVGRAFDRQLESLLRDEILDLDAEIAVLQKTAALEGAAVQLPSGAATGSVRAVAEPPPREQSKD